MTDGVTPAGVLTAGEWIGGYELQDRLRSGGMATLYLARRHGTAGFSRRIALKVIHPHLTYDTRFINMFVDEARICSHIEHPNVVRVEEFGVDRGLHFLAMEYIDGCSLNEILRLLAGNPMPVALATRIAMQIASGLHAAHETTDDTGESLHIIHRDVSPANILISREGAVKVIDFGVAKARGRVGATVTGGTIKGKLRYMSPEQAASKDIDRRADIYALGVMYWEMLAGTQLFKSGMDDASLLWQRMSSDHVAPPSSVNPTIPPEVDELVLRLLARDPEHRVGSGAEARRLMTEVVPAAQSVDVGEIATLVGQVLALPSSEREDGQEPASHRSNPKPMLTSSGSNSGRRPDEAQITVTDHLRSRRIMIAIGVGVVAIVGMVITLVGLRGGDAKPEQPAPVPTAAVAPAPAPTPVAAPAPAPAPVPAPAPAAVAATAPAPTEEAPAKHTQKSQPAPRNSAPAHVAAAPATPAAPKTDPRPSSVAGHTLAEAPDSDIGVNRASANAPKPATVGKTSIADKFEE